MSDLVRSRVSYWLYTAAAGVFLRNSFAYDDGRLSIRKSLTKREAQLLVASDPSLAGLQVRSVFPGHLVFLSRPPTPGSTTSASGCQNGARDSGQAAHPHGRLGHDDEVDVV